MTRAWRHVCLASAFVLPTTLAWFGGNAALALDRASLATAWICVALFSAALLVGPAAISRAGRPVLNSLLRRDLGIWCALAGLAHLTLATVLVMSPVYFRSYITGPPGAPLPGVAGWAGTGSILAGYVVGLVFLLLLAISNNWSLQRLGPGRWKRWQRSASLAFGLTVVHGAVFQIIEGRSLVWLPPLLAMTGAVLWLRRRARQEVVGT